MQLFFKQLLTYMDAIYLDHQLIKMYDDIKTMPMRRVDIMSTKDKPIGEIEKQILDELEEEIRELKKQKRLYKFETAMDHAKEKFEKALKERTKHVIEKVNKEEGEKKTAQNAEDQQE